MDNHDFLEEAFLKNKVNFKTHEADGTVTHVTNNSDGVIIHKSVNVDQHLKAAKIERDNFRMSRNSDDHYTKVASIPLVMFQTFMAECDQLGITSNKERNRYVINKLRSPEFEALLSIPKNMLRG